MVSLLWGAVGILTFTTVFLLIKVLLLQKSADEICRAFTWRITNDTNTLIDVSSNDKHIRHLAAQINIELRALRRERRRLQNGDLELKEAVTNISHDLRTPLTAISGYLDLLEQEEKSETVCRYIDVIKERTQALKVLTEELFRYSVITSTAEELTLEDVSLNDALEVSLAAFYSILTERLITPKITMPPQPVLRRLDSTALHRIFNNILNNAAKYSDGDLAVTLFDDGTVVFCNTAKKLNPVEAERLFDRFYTVENARNSTGLGLSIAKILTEKMHGEITENYEDNKLSIIVKFTD